MPYNCLDPAEYIGLHLQELRAVGAGGMQAQFEATVDDFADVMLRGLAGSKIARVGRWRNVFTAAALIAVSIYLIFPGSQRLKLLAALLGFAFITLGNAVTYKSFLRGKLRALAKEHIGGARPVVVRVELTSGGIRFEQLGGQYFSDWSTIERLEETQDTIYFYQRNKSCMAVRKRAFESQESEDQFVEFARNHVNSPAAGTRPV